MLEDNKQEGRKKYMYGSNYSVVKTLSQRLHRRTFLPAEPTCKWLIAINSSIH